MSRKKTQGDRGRASALPQDSQILSAGEGTRCTRGGKSYWIISEPSFSVLFVPGLADEG